jgi:hypothetical protein
MEPDDFEPPVETRPPDPDEPVPLPDPPACAGDSPFAEPVALPLDPALSIAGAWLSPDGLELLVGAQVDAQAEDTNAFDLLRAERADPDGVFGPLLPIDELNTPLLERKPTLTPDGLTIYFESDRSGESSDIYVAERAERGAPFGVPRLAEPVSTGRDDVPGAVSLQTNSLFFSADRIDGPGKENVYRAARLAGDAFAETFLISSIDSDSSNVAPAPSSDELTLYFSSNRDSVDLSYDVYRARRMSLEGFYDLPLPVPELSSNGSDIVAWLAADECTILLTRESPLGSGHVSLFMAKR